VSTYGSIAELRSQLGARQPSPSTVAYAEKMLHKVPSAPVLDRAKFILEQCRGKRVLEFGASGPMHDAIRTVVTETLGVDRVAAEGVVGFDLDDVSQETLPSFNAEIIVCGELLEHLSNPGWFLTRLRRQYPSVPVIITVPNAYCSAGGHHISKGVENVNRDHVAWYSYRTLMTLLERVGYTTNVFAWYNGRPHTAEGLIVVTE
jgi:hypothetical protein